MSLPCRCALMLAALAGSLWSGQAGASGGSLGVPPPPPPPMNETGSAFDGMRKPPVPVSFLAHEAGWIAFQYPPSARERVAPLIAQADDLRGELAETLGQVPLDGIEVRVARGPEEMATLAPPGSERVTEPPPAGAERAHESPRPSSTGVAYPKIKLIVLSLGSSAPLAASELGGAFRRELARIALDEAVGRTPLPAWFVDGFVAAFSGDSDWLRSAGLYATAVRRKLLPIALVELDLQGRQGRAESSLAEAADFMAFLTEPEQHIKLAGTLAALRDGRASDEALLAGYGVPLARLEDAWRRDLQRRATGATLAAVAGLPAALALAWYGVRAFRRRRARALARAVVARSKERDSRRVHIVFGRRHPRSEQLPALPEAEIPKVEHEGEWHTLH